MGIAVLGPLSIDGGTTTLGRRDRTVLAALAVHPGDEVRTERLYDALWGESPPSSATKVVQGCVVRLRKALGAGAIQTTGEGYRLALPADDIDSCRFDRALRHGAELLEGGAPDRAAAVLTDALTWWRGEPLPELVDWDDGRQEADRLGQLRLQAEELYVEAALACGHHDRVLSKALAMVQESPLRERRWVLLARTHYQAGRQSEALDVLRRLRRVLDRELGLAPGRDVADLEQAILRQDAALSAPPHAAEADILCPYPGLMAYDVTNSGSFFGRDEELAACLRRLRDQAVVALVGPSGSGKSSLVRAGIAASLLRDGRKIAVMAPGQHPMSALADLSLAATTVLIVDQLEEVFSLCGDLDERSRFLTTLVHRSSTAQLVVSIRADHLTEVADHADFARLFEQGLYLLGSMDEVRLRSAIEGPAREAGLVVEPGLVDLLVNEVEHQPGALPLLSHTMSETWQRREGRTLTLAAYRDSGGVRGAVAKSAEAIYTRADPARQSALRDIMMRLVTLEDDGTPLRTRLPRRLVVRDPSHDDIVDEVIAARLVTSDDTVIELAHEALTSAWPRLRGWLEEDVDGQRVRQHVAFAADAWDALGRPDSEVYRGVRLSTALDWRRRHGQELSPTENDFLDRGERVADAEHVAADQQARAQQRANRRLRGLLVLATGLVVATLIAGLLAVRQADRAELARLAAERSSDRAGAAALTADSRRFGARALTTEDISLSLLLGVQGLRLENSPESRTNLLAALARRPQLIRTGFGHGPHITSLAVRPLPDSYLTSRGLRSRWAIATSEGNNEVVTFDQAVDRVSSSRFVGRDPRGGDVSVAFSPDGSILAAGMNTADRAPVQLVDAIQNKPLARQLPPNTRPTAVADIGFSGNGRYVAATFHSAESAVANGRTGGGPKSADFALVWDPRGEGVSHRVDLPSGLHGMALSPDGRTVYTSWPLTAHDVTSGRQLWRSPLRGWQHLDINRAGTLLAMPEWDDASNTNVVLVDATTGALRRRLVGHREQTGDVRFSPSGSRVASLANDNSALIWDVRRARVLDRLETGDVNAVAFSPDGRKLITGGEDSAVRVWDLSGEERYVARTGTGQPVPLVDGRVHPSRDGRAVAYLWRPSGGDSYRLRFYDVATKTLGRIIRTGDRDASGLGSWRADRMRYATTGDGVVRVWNPETGRVVTAGKVAESLVTSALFSVDGRHLVATDASGIVRMLEAATLRPIGIPVDVGGDACCVTLGAGEQAAVFSTPTVARRNLGSSSHSRWNLVDLGAGKLLSSRALAMDVLAADSSPDGEKLAVTGVGGEMWLLDSRTGQPVSQPPVGDGADNIWVAYADDGAQVVTGAVDGTLGLWDGRTGRLLGTVGLPEKTPLAATFLYGGQDLLIASHAGGVYHWNSLVSEASTFACALAGRTLTRTEWREFTDRPYQPRCPKLPGLPPDLS